jgi:DNA (cytosine-5)-methyltransferase 1
MIHDMSTSIAPKVIDVFAGVGGLSLGAARAGFDVRAVVENDPIAIATHAINFPKTNHIARDVSRLSGSDLLNLAGLDHGDLDGLIGGPPCQGFSLMGHRNADDPRNSLFFDFFRLVKQTKPRFFLAENVPGILANGNRTVVERAWSMLPPEYVLFEPIKIRAADFGAPTTRTRVFIVGINRNEMDEHLLGKDVVRITPDPTFVGHALSGLPAIRAGWQEESLGWRTVGDLPNDGFFKRVAGRIPQGVGDPNAIRRFTQQHQVSGCVGTTHTSETIDRFRKVRPGESDLISRSPRLHKLGFCPTLRAGTGTDRGSFQAVRPIHPGSPRVITPREAARLQGFPDWFQFHHTKWHAFRQIGNSVCPIVGEVIMRALAKKLQ